MSASKVKANSIKLKDAKKKLIEIIVNTTESAFKVKIQNDDGGANLMIYLPESERNNFDQNSFRSIVDAKLGRVRTLLCFVHDGYIENFLGD